MSPAMHRRPLAFARGALAGTVLFACATVPAAATDRVAWIHDLGLGEGLPLVVLPPGAGRVIAVDEQRMTDRFVQTVALQGDAGTIGENQIVIVVTRNGLAPRIEEDTVATEVQKQLPDIALGLGPTGTQNAFGVFGAVSGSKDGLNCVYAWQRVNLADAWINGEVATAFEERHAMTMRYRLCRTAATRSELIAFVQGAQSGLFNSRAMPRFATGFDALTAAASLTVEPGAVERDIGRATNGEGPVASFARHSRAARSTRTLHARSAETDAARGAGDTQLAQPNMPPVPMP